MIVRTGFVVMGEYLDPAYWTWPGRWQLHGRAVDGCSRIEMTDLAVFSTREEALEALPSIRGSNRRVMSINLQIAEFTEEAESFRGKGVVIVVCSLPARLSSTELPEYAFYGPLSSVDERKGIHSSGELPLLAQVGWDRRFQDWDAAESIRGEYQRQSTTFHSLGLLELHPV